MPLTPILFFCLMTALLAARKGYNPFCWFFAGGLIGLIALSLRPFINNGQFSDADRMVLQQKGDRIGLIISGIAVGLSLFFAVLRNFLL